MKTPQATHTRREFLADVGKGMVTAAVGCGLAAELGLASAIAEELDDARSEMDESVNKPTAMTVRRIISERVTIRAKPRSPLEKRAVFKGFIGF